MIEHIDPENLDEVARNLFGHAHPRTVVVTTPNAEYNALFESLPAGKFRHGDHRFEWTRAEFQAWCESVASTYGYVFRTEGIGPVDEQYGSPSQCAVFERAQGDAA